MVEESDHVASTNIYTPPPACTIGQETPTGWLREVSIFLSHFYRSLSYYYQEVPVTPASKRVATTATLDLGRTQMIKNTCLPPSIAKFN